MKTSRKNLLGLLVSVVTALPLLCAPSFAAPAGPSASLRGHHKVHTVFVSRLCAGFGTSDLKCKGGYASAAGTQVKYQAKAYVDYSNDTLLRAKHNTCKVLHLAFFIHGADEGRVKVSTVNGSFKAKSEGSALVTLDAKVSKKPFTVTGSSVNDFTGTLYLLGKARCLSKSGQ